MFLSQDAILWALNHLEVLPKDQLVLFFFLALAKEGTLSRGTPGNPSPFENEIMKYLGAPLPGEGKAVFSPLEHQWRATDYMNSTVYGRLLNGSHRWTEGKDAFFSREPATGWPAKFTLNEKGFDNLRTRTSPPCLRASSRLPMTAVAIYYFRFLDLSEFAPRSLKDLVAEYRREVLDKHPRLDELFVPGPNFLSGTLFSSEALTEREMLECYPPCPSSGEPKKNVLLYKEDLEAIKTHMSAGEDVSDYVRNLLKEKGI